MSNVENVSVSESEKDGASEIRSEKFSHRSSVNRVCGSITPGRVTTPEFREVFETPQRTTD